MQTVDAKNDELKKRAALAYCQGMTQDQIAGCLNVSQSTVSKLLSEAKKEGWIVTKIAFTGPLSEQERKKLSIYEPGETLKVKLKQRSVREAWDWELPKIHIHFGGEIIDSNDWDQAVIRWSQNAAPVMHSLLSGSKHIGISLGRTMRALVDALTRLSEGRENKIGASIHESGKKIFPLRGPRLVMWREEDDGAFSDPHKLTANSIATDLNRIFNNISDFDYAMSWHLTVPELIGFSESFPFEYKSMHSDDEKFLNEEREFVTRFVESCGLTAANAMVFGKAIHSTGLCDSADTLVMPIAQSGTTRSLMPFKKEFAGIPPEWLENNTVGDIGTVLLPKDGITERNKLLLQRISNRQPGIRLEHIKNCAINARKQATTGVVGCAVGQRAKPVLKCIELGLLNHLFLDHVCVNDLLELLK